jgi:hypothetical protein
MGDEERLKEASEVPESVELKEKELPAAIGIEATETVTETAQDNLSGSEADYPPAANDAEEQIRIKRKNIMTVC